MTSLTAAASGRQRVVVITIAFAIVVVATIVGLLVGPVRLDASGVLGELFGWLPFVGDGGLDEQQATILWQLRAPRVALACVVGACLAVSGAAYQGAFRNPLADPVPAGRRRRGRARRDPRPGLGGRRLVRRRHTAVAARVVRAARSWASRSPTRSEDRWAGARRPGSCWPVSRSPRSSRRCRRSCNSRTPTRCARCTRGSSEGSGPQDGTTSC